MVSAYMYLQGVVELNIILQVQPILAWRVLVVYLLEGIERNRKLPNTTDINLPEEYWWCQLEYLLRVVGQNRIPQKEEWKP